MKNKIAIIVLIFLAGFFRFYNLDLTARFTRDESSDMVSIKKIYDQKKITLIGPMSEGNVSVFSSLTYYLLLPFGALTNFDPIGGAIGTAVYGIITVILLGIFFKKMGNWRPWGLLLVIFAPLLESSRWAWNPHFVPLWQAAGLLMLFSRRKLSFLIAGLCFGLSIHQHWYAVFTALLPGLRINFFGEKKGNKFDRLKRAGEYYLGLFLGVSPFILFDLTHPPGLFVSRMFYFSPLSGTGANFSLMELIIKAAGLIGQYFDYLCAGINYAGGAAILLTTITVAINIKKGKNETNLWLIPLLVQVAAISLTKSEFSNRYFLPTIIFYLIWLLKSIEEVSAKGLWILLLFCSVIVLPKELRRSDWTNNIRALNNITDFMVNDIEKDETRFNLVVLQSPDGNTKGLRFRDMLWLKGKVPLGETDYDGAKYLYVISYQKKWEELSADPAYEINNFRQGLVEKRKEIDDSDWVVYKVLKTNN